MKIIFKPSKVLLGLSVLCTLTLVSCKSKQVTTKEDTIKKEEIKQFNKTIEQYYKNKFDFSTLYIKANARFTNEKMNQKVAAEIKIKKGEQILVSIRFLGITMAKALITPTKVCYYEKLKGTYYEGDFSALSQFLGTDLDFIKIQNLLLGQTVDNLKSGSFIESLENQTYKLVPIENNNTQKAFYIDSLTYLLKKQEIAQMKEERKVQIEYSNTKDFSQLTVPMNLKIDSFQKKGTAQIDLEYTNISINEELSFPYSVPNDYKRILIQ